MAAHGAARHRVIAGNLSQANTPGYRAQDVVPFDQMIARSDRGASREPARMTRIGHADRPNGEIAIPRMAIGGPAAPNGNDVVIEDQTLRAAEAESQHRLALRLYDKSIALLRLGLGRLR
ncbi:MAG: hypothetical protein AAFQ88_00960 [Pseudomonadota bacterium]